MTDTEETKTPTPEAMPADTAAPEDAPVARFVNPVTKTLQLTYPVEFDGRVYAEVNFHRMTGIEVRDFAMAISEGNPPKPPCIDIPQEVYDALDDDDLFEVDKVVMDFLPRRLRTASALTSAGGGQSSLN